jgi:pyruvate dehydrogenase E1 component alpha subunit
MDNTRAQGSPCSVSHTFNFPPTPCIETLKSFLSMMWLIRRFEEKAAEKYTQGKIAGFCHLCIGQEAIAVGASFAMGSHDTMITAYRAHGHALARGLTPFQVMAELMGKEGGCSKGKGGSMHMFYAERGFYGGHGIVGAQTSLGTGLAFAHKYLDDKGVCLTFLGDGASNQGQFFESMNMAALWSLPVLYIIENNGYAMGTSVARGCAGPDLYKRGEPFGIPGHRISGDDVIEVYQTIRAMIEVVHNEQKPLLLEIDTYRFKGHSVSDPGKYRTRDELDQARHSRDPIDRLSAYLIDEGSTSPEELADSEKRVTESVVEAVQLAEQAPEPDQSELWKDIML